MSKIKINPIQERLNSQFDVIVVGAGSGGISAAVQAARMGSETLLIEPSANLGGQLLVVSTMDEADIKGHGFPIRKSGIYAEFIDRVREIYDQRGKTLGTCYWREDSIGFEPQVAEQVLSEMLKEESKLTVLTQTSVTLVFTDHQTVTGITTTQGKTIHCKILIDATECGDIIPLTPARYRVGNSTNEDINQDACIQDITYPAVIEKYPGGAPEELVIDDPPPNYEKYLEQFTATVNHKGYNWYQNTCGEAGDQPCWGNYPVNWLTHHAYRGLPNSRDPNNYAASYPSAEEITKTVINWANDLPVKVSYLEDRSQREIDNRKARLKTISFLYYLQQQLGSEWAVTDHLTNLAKEELSHSAPDFRELVIRMPPFPYVRESRRIIPLQTLTASDIHRIGSPPTAEGRFSHAVAVGYYPADLHGCKGDQTLNLSLENSSDSPQGFVSGPFQVPFECLIPEKVDGFLAAEKNIGVSRIVNGATRLGPITMVVGQAVGAIAGLAIKNNLQPREIDPLQVQLEMLSNDHKLSVFFYQDLPRNHPLWEVVELVNTYQLIAGVSPTEFGIKKTISRAEVVKAFCLTLELDLHPPPSPSFKDVKPESWVYPYLETLHEYLPLPPSQRGLTYFCPSEPVMRKEMNEMISHILQKNPRLGAKDSLLNPSSQDYSEFWLKKLRKWGITDRKGKRKFHPQKEVTRGEAAALFYTFLVKR